MIMVYEGKTFRGSASGEIVESSFTREELSPNDVVVKITHSGLCGTDLHYLNIDMVLGHEGVGVVQEVRPSCKRLNVGDRVGWGYMHETCGLCRECQTGNEVFCQGKRCFGSANFDQGSLGELGVWKEDWLFKLPDALTSEQAAPLMCAGSTVFTPLIKYCKPTDRVGIVGIGGLGHLAIQFAAKMGCDVVVFSGTDSKREEALSLGANEFYATKGVDDLSQIGLPKPINRLIITTAGMVDYDLYFEVLAPKATVIPLTVTDPKYTMGVPYVPFAWKGAEVVGTAFAGRVMHNDILEFAARNKITPMIEKYPMTTEGITEAMDRLYSGTRFNVPVGLQGLYDKYKDRDFVILGFPCNQFGGQEPKDDEAIGEFCSRNHGVTFPLMKKSNVNGDNTNEVFKWLKNEKAGLLGLTRIKWNSEKFLVNKEGKVVHRWASTTTPEHTDVEVAKIL